jgi:hypothetical protein
MQPMHGRLLTLLIVGGVVPFTSGCLLDAAPAEGVLARTDGEPPGADGDDESLPLAERGRRLQGDVDRLSAAALAEARRAEGDPDLALEAARRLFQAADLRLRRCAMSTMTVNPPADVEQVFEAEEEIEDESVVEEVLSLCTTGLELAETVVQSRPRDVDAQLHKALHLSMVARMNGPTRSLLAGFGPKLKATIATAVELGPDHDCAGPLRLQGRFLSQAPWPFGDLDAALLALQRAVEAAPVCINHLFLGDALYAAEQKAAAVAEWQAALAAPICASNRYSGPFLRAAAERRLAAVGTPPSQSG